MESNNLNIRIYDNMHRTRMLIQTNNKNVDVYVYENEHENKIKDYFIYFNIYFHIISYD